jgi:4-phytase/acid phosphatase
VNVLESLAPTLARAVVALLLGAAALDGFAPAAPRLIYAVAFARHGVRAPTWTMDRLRQWSAEDWPSFGVAPGELTLHGREAIQKLAAYYREWMTHEGLIGGGCADASHLFVRADKDQRTLETAHAFAGALLPGCTVPVHDGGADDPLFNPMGAGHVSADPEAIAGDARAKLGTEAARARLRDLKPAFAALQHVLTNGAAAEHTLGEQGWDVTVNGTATGLELAGPIATASTLSEDLLLEFSNGFTGHDLGWGRIDEPTLLRILELHTTYADFARRSPGIAKARGSNLLAHIVASMEQAATGRAVAGAIDTPGTTVLLISGHDTNQSNLSGMLDLAWRLPGYQPDDTPPGGALVFMLWRDPASPELLVRLRYLAQTPVEMAQLTTLTLAHPPASVDVPVPACQKDVVAGGCPWPAFAHLAQRAVDPAFVVK